MTYKDAIQIEQAAIVLLRAVAVYSDSGDVKAALRTLRLRPDLEGHVSLRTARELLENTDAWKNEGDA